MSSVPLFLPLFVVLCFCARTFPHTTTVETPRAGIQSYHSVQGYSLPSTSAWAALNDTFGGRLQELRPWAAVCYVDDPLYDSVKCQSVLSNYTNDNVREDIPSALLWANWESCGFDKGCALNYSNPQPVSGETCHQGTTPTYSIAISGAEDASIVVKWATAHNVKLTIKNTGHDYQGRSSGPSSLQVLTHHLKSIAYVTDFVPQGSSAAPVPALKISAGAQLEESKQQVSNHTCLYALLIHYLVYAVLEVNNISAVLGGCLTVGAGEWLHLVVLLIMLCSILNRQADLSREGGMIVTADGVFRTINSVQDPDLFWAVRGGGAGSWGIIISITLAALPPTAIGGSSLIIEPNATQNLQTLGVGFLALVGKYQNQIINSGITTTMGFLGGGYIAAYGVSFLWPAEHASISVLYPLFDELRALSSNYTILSNITQESLYPSLATAILEGVGPQDDSLALYGGSTEIASRFVPQSMFESPESVQSVAEAIWEGLQIATAPLADYPDGVFNPQVSGFIMGEMPIAMRDRVNETAANPGFFDAAWEVVYLGSWTVGTSQSTRRLLTQAVYNATGPLKALGLTSTYQNEGSAWEMNWQEAFFGYKYDRSLQIKEKYDPTNWGRV
ncbi:hypothetical protein JVU11DRAFT_10417 [Chiua virens]|nr:hypothetical protein JVU11DRAFT_10417 [Chiua virens]